jgi:hypothetical protein
MEQYPCGAFFKRSRSERTARDKNPTDYYSTHWIEIETLFMRALASYRLRIITEDDIVADRRKSMRLSFPCPAFSFLAFGSIF